MGGIDRRLAESAYHAGPDAFAPLVAAIASTTAVALLVGLATAACVLRGHRRGAVAVPLAGAAGAILGTALKPFGPARHGWELGFVHRHHASVDYPFPSGHTAAAVAAATCATIIVGRRALPLVAFALAIGAARVWAGYHFPSDIAGGAVLGGLIGWAFAEVAHPPSRRRRAPEPAATDPVADASG